MSMLTTAQAADRLGVQPVTLRRWRYTGTGPAYVKVGGRIRYDSEDITAYLAARRTDPAATSGER